MHARTHARKRMRTCIHMHTHIQVRSFGSFNDVLDMSDRQLDGRSCGELIAVCLVGIRVGRVGDPTVCLVMGSKASSLSGVSSSGAEAGNAIVGAVCVRAYVRACVRACVRA